METIIKKGYWKIFKLFYNNKNSYKHLREISRNTKMNESSISRNLNFLVKNKFLISKKEGNMKMFKVNKKAIPKIFPIYDIEKFENLPLLRKNAIKFYLENLEKKPVTAAVFGSSAKGSYKQDYDVDILEIVNSKQDNKKAKKYAESQTGIRIQIFQINLKKFIEELKIKKDNVIQSAIKTGFPVFNNKYYYEVVYNE